MSNEIDEDLVKEFLQYYSETAIPDPDQYPKRLHFMIEAFLHHKRMKNED
jgi:hypothetical protein